MRMMCCLMLAAALTGLAGCQDPLAGERLPQTPYQRYEQLHGRSRPPHQPGFEPSLREQLRPLE
ncbi:MAG: hypothetical protein ACLFV3_07560 [Phycisphaeraceae bacterium]